MVGLLQLLNVTALVDRRVRAGRHFTTLNLYVSYFIMATVVASTKNVLLVHALVDLVLELLGPPALAELRPLKWSIAYNMSSSFLATCSRHGSSGDSCTDTKL